MAEAKLVVIIIVCALIAGVLIEWAPKAKSPNETTRNQCNFAHGTMIDGACLVRGAEGWRKL